jgi:hypothetical protein
MQAFYTNLFSDESKDHSVLGLLRIARSNLKEILAVRSELAWEWWD